MKLDAVCPRMFGSKLTFSFGVLSVFIFYKANLKDLKVKKLTFDKYTVLPLQLNVSP